MCAWLFIVAAMDVAVGLVPITNVYKEGDGQESTVTCASGSQMLWGFSLQTADDQASSIKAGNIGCAKGVTSCTKPNHNAVGNDEFMLSGACVQNAYANRWSYSLKYLNCDVGCSMSCKNGQTIVGGFIVRYTDETAIESGTNSIRDANTACPVGSTKCTAATAHTKGDDEGHGMMICSSDPPPSSMVQQVYKRGNGNIGTRTCPSGFWIAYGFTMQWSDDLTGATCIKANRRKCNPGLTSCVGSTSDCNSPGDDESFLWALCAKCDEGCSTCSSMATCTACDVPSLAVPSSLQVAACECRPGLSDALSSAWSQDCQGTIAFIKQNPIVAGESSTHLIRLSFPVVSGSIDVSVSGPNMESVSPATFTAGVQELPIEIMGLSQFLSATVDVSRSGSSVPSYNPVDTTADVYGRPTVRSISVSQLVDSTVVVQFSVEMDTPSAEAAFSMASDGGVPVSGVFAWRDSNSMEFRPVGMLSGTIYNINMAGGVAESIYAIVMNEPASTSLRTLAFVYFSLPLPGAVDMGLDQFVSIVFRTKMNRPVTEAAFNFTTDGAPVAVTFEWEQDGIVLMVYPVEPLVDSTRYTCALGPSAQNVDMETQDYEFAWDFETIRILPVVVSTNPIKSATNVPLSAPIVVEFSKSMDTASVAASLRVLDINAGAALAGAISWNNSDTVMTYTPYAPLNDQSRFLLEITQNAADVRGNFISELLQQVFHSEDRTPPEISYVDPSGDQVDVNTLVTVGFTEPMSTLSSFGIVLRTPDGGQVAVLSSWNIDTTEVALTPVTPLQDDTDFDIVITEVSDISGNILLIPMTESFRTAPTCEPACPVVATCTSSMMCTCTRGWGPHGAPGAGGTDACTDPLLLGGASPALASTRSSLHVTITGTLFPPAQNWTCVFNVSGEAVTTTGIALSTTELSCALPASLPSPVIWSPGSTVDSTLTVAAAGLEYDVLAFAFAECPSGSESTGDGSCAPCPAGTQLNLELNQSTCTACPEGLFAEQTGSVSCYVCSECVAALQDLDDEAAASESTTTFLFVGLGVLFCVVCLAAALIVAAMRHTRRKTLKRYYIEDDATIRQGDEGQFGKIVEKLLLKKNTTRIGAGEYADIFKANFEGRWIALKIASGEHGSSAAARAEFHQEATILGLLNSVKHPAVIELVFFCTNPMSIALAFCEGGSLKQRLKEDEDVEESDKIRWLAEAAGGMAAVHKMGVLHLDLKTDNILLMNDSAVVMDFGIAKLNTSVDNPQQMSVSNTASMNMASMQSASLATMETALAFSVRYVDPVRLFCEYGTSGEMQKADVFSFAMTMWAMLAAREPYVDIPTEDLTKKLRADPTMRPEIPEGVNEEVCELMTDAWVLEVEQRPSFVDIQERLCAVLLETHDRTLPEEYVVSC